MRENKEAFVVRIGYLLTLDERSEVERVRYTRDGDEEYVEITFTGGHIVAVNVTADSCGAILYDVGRAVYGW